MEPDYSGYKKLAQGLNPNRSYVFLDIDALRRDHPDDAGFRQAVKNSIQSQLGKEATPALLSDFVEAASDMKKSKFDGDAKIFSQNGHETAMVYWAWPADTTRSSFVGDFSGYSPDAQRRMKINPAFASTIASIKQEVITHEIGHATSPERNATNTSVRFETGHEGLYNNHRSELRAEIVGAMERMRTEGSTRTAQDFNDMRAMRLFLHGGEEYDSMPGRVFPNMEYLLCLKVQKVIDEARRTGNTNFTDREIAETADRISKQEDDSFRQNDLLVKAGQQFKRIQDKLSDVPEEHKLQAALDRGLLKPEDDLTKILVAAHEHITGERLGAFPQAPDVGGHFDDVSPPRPQTDAQAAANLARIGNALGLGFTRTADGAGVQLSAQQTRNLMDAIQRNPAFCNKLFPGRADQFDLNQSGFMTVRDLAQFSQKDMDNLNKNAPTLRALLNSGLDAAMRADGPKAAVAAPGR